MNYLSIAPATDILSQRALKGSPSPEVIAAIQKYAALYGLDPQLMLDVVAFESGGTFDPHSINRKSNAAGLFQIIPGTWDDLAVRYGLTDRYDIDQNVEAGAINLSNALYYLKNHGVDNPSDEAIYLSHNQGAAGALALIQNRDENVVDALETLRYYSSRPGSAAQAVTQNGGDTTMSARQFFPILTSRFSATAQRTPRIGSN